MVTITQIIVTVSAHSSLLVKPRLKATSFSTFRACFL